jgi:hypothetical protein
MCTIIARCAKLLHCELHKRVTLPLFEQLQLMSKQQVRQDLEACLTKVGDAIKTKEGGSTNCIHSVYTSCTNTLMCLCCASS